MGDQFLALQKGRTQPADDGRRVDDDAVRNALATQASTVWSIFDFLDPWGNRDRKKETAIMEVTNKGTAPN